MLTKHSCVPLSVAISWDDLVELCIRVVIIVLPPWPDHMTVSRDWCWIALDLSIYAESSFCVSSFFFFFFFLLSVIHAGWGMHFCCSFCASVRTVRATTVAHLKPFNLTWLSVDNWWEWTSRYYNFLFACSSLDFSFYQSKSYKWEEPAHKWIFCYRKGRRHSIKRNATHSVVDPKIWSGGPRPENGRGKVSCGLPHSTVDFLFS